MSRFTFTTSKDLTVSVLDSEADGATILLQPSWPDGTAWANKAEAEAWATQFILSLTDETAELVGVTPSEPTMPRPVVVEDVPPAE